MQQVCGSCFVSLCGVSTDKESIDDDKVECYCRAVCDIAKVVRRPIGTTSLLDAYDGAASRGFKSRPGAATTTRKRKTPT